MLAMADNADGVSRSKVLCFDVEEGLINSINEGNVNPDAKQYSFHTSRSLKYLENPRIINIGQHIMDRKRNYMKGTWLRF